MKGQLKFSPVALYRYDVWHEGYGMIAIIENNDGWCISKCLSPLNVLQVKKISEFIQRLELGAQELAKEIKYEFYNDGGEDSDTPGGVIFWLVSESEFEVKRVNETKKD